MMEIKSWKVTLYCDKCKKQVPRLVRCGTKWVCGSCATGGCVHDKR